MSTHAEQPSANESKEIRDLEPAPVAQDENVKGGADAAVDTFWSVWKATAESKGQVQGELARFR